MTVSNLNILFLAAGYELRATSWYQVLRRCNTYVAIFDFMRILMVCLGNICRSPLAEGILRNRIAKAGLDWTVDSAGTGNYHIGEPPHTLSIKAALANGIDISSQQCRQFVREDMVSFDRIYVMDEENYEEVRRISGKSWDEEKVSLILDELYPGEKKNVPDPWYGTEKDFHFVFDMLSRACDKIVERYAGAARS